MRNSFLLLSIAAFVAACSEQQQPTSPATIGASASASAGLLSTSPLATANGKPTDQVGFTKVFTVTGASVNIVGIAGPKAATASCPAGSYAVGGSYEINAPLQSRYFIYIKSGLDNANGWSVTGYAIDPFANMNLTPTVTCIQ